MNAEPTLALHADDAYQAIRTINHLTITRPVIPAPDLYPVLGNLAQLGHGLAQAVGQLAAGLERSPEKYELYEADPARDPADSLTEAADWLADAADWAAVVGHALAKAQTAIAGQGWHSRTDDPNPEDEGGQAAGDPSELDGADS